MATIRPTQIQIPVGYPNDDPKSGPGMTQSDFDNGAIGGDSLRTFSELALMPTWAMLDEEFKRDYASCIVAGWVEAGLMVGIGTGWRSFAAQQANFERNPAQFADPRYSLHVEKQATGRAYAIDTVPYDALNWCHKNAERFGLNWLEHIPNERHHVQPMTFPNGGKATFDRFASLVPLPVRDLPYLGTLSITEWLAADVPIEVAHDKRYPGSESGVVWDPANKRFGLWPLAPSKPRILRGTVSDHVRYVQWVLGATPDGVFGPRTEAVVRAFQAFLGLEVDGIVGRNTWAAVDRFALALQTQAEALQG